MLYANTVWLSVKCAWSCRARGKYTQGPESPSPPPHTHHMGRAEAFSAGEGKREGWREGLGPDMCMCTHTDEGWEDAGGWEAPGWVDSGGVGEGMGWTTDTDSDGDLWALVGTDPWVEEG